MTKTIVITGGAGFLGSHVIENVLRTTDWNVISIDSFRHNGTMTRLLESSDEAHDRVVSLTHDLTVPITTHQANFIRRRDVATIFNIASRSHVTESINDSASFIKNNVDLVVNMLELAIDVDASRFIQMSTDEVYGPHRPQSVYEYRPSSPYAASKAAQEAICHAYDQTYGVPMTVVNSANMFGPRQQEGAFIPLVIQRLLAKQVIDVHHVDLRPGERNYVYVENVADRLVRLVEHNRDDERVLIHGQETLTNVDVVERVARLMGVDPHWRWADAELTRPGYDPSYPSLEGTWQAPISLDEGLRRTVNWGVIYFNGE